MKLRCFLFILVNTQVVFANEITFGRCEKDKLVKQEEVLGRIEWAIKCRKQTGFTEDDKVRMLFEVGPNMKVRQRREALYPVFAKAASNEVWRAPIQKTAACKIPNGFALRGFCHRGCLAPEQLVLFPDGFQPIAEAEEGHRSQIMALHSGATLDDLSFEPVQVKKIIGDLFDAKQTVRVLQMANGEDLRVTLDHPMMMENGRLKEAGDLQIGEKLLHMNGGGISIMGIAQESFKGRVFNVIPESWKKAHNIFVVNGFLTGSMRYQNRAIDWLNRKLLRRSLPEDLFF